MSEPARRPVIEERLHPLSPVVRLWIGVVAVAWFLATSFLQGDPIWQDVGRLGDRLRGLPWWLLLVVGAAVIGLVLGYWSWWTTRFVIDDHEFRLENTGAFQESQRIAFSRIQSVDVTQPFAARLLGLAQVKIDVGAEGGATLSFLERRRATEIRDYLMARAHGRQASTAEPGRSASAWDDASAGDQVLIRLTPGEIILSAFASAEIFWISLGFVLPWALGLLFDWSLAMGGGMVGLALALVGYLSNRLFGQFNYTLARTPAGLRITRGLFTLRSQTIPAHRVQAVQTRQPLVWRWLGRARLDISVLGLGSLEESEGMTTSTIYLPFGSPAQVQVALAAVWPGLELERLAFARTPERARWLDPLQWPWVAFALDDRVLVVRSGWTHRRQLIVPHARVQSMRLHQGPWQRRLGLASLQVHTAGGLGLDGVHHLDAPRARALALDEMDRARASRVGELLDPPGLRAPGTSPDAAGAVWPGGPAASGIDVWTPPTAPLPPSRTTSAQPPAP